MPDVGFIVPQPWEEGECILTVLREASLCLTLSHKQPTVGWTHEIIGSRLFKHPIQNNSPLAQSTKLGPWALGMLPPPSLLFRVSVFTIHFMNYPGPPLRPLPSVHILTYPLALWPKETTDGMEWGMKVMLGLLFGGGPGCTCTSSCVCLFAEWMREQVGVLGWNGNLWCSKDSSGSVSLAFLLLRIIGRRLPDIGPCPIVTSEPGGLGLNWKLRPWVFSLHCSLKNESLLFSLLPHQNDLTLKEQICFQRSTYLLLNL